MTIHGAITYFDPETESMGFLVGSDGNAAVEEIVDGSSQTRKRTFQVDKSFRGKNTVGFMRGIVPRNDADPETDFSTHMASLTDVFDEIGEGVDYSRVKLLQDSKKYVLMIGQRSNTSLDLYTISNARDQNKHVAERMCRLTPEMYHTRDKVLLWYAACDTSYIPFSLKVRLGETEASTFLEKIVTVSSSELKVYLNIEKDYDPGKATIFKLNFQGITRLD